MEQPAAPTAEAPAKGAPAAASVAAAPPTARPAASLPAEPPSLPSGPIEADPGWTAWTEANVRAEAADWGAARVKAFEALESARSPELRRRIEDLLGRAHIALVFSPAPMPEKVDYTIRPGDTLAGIAKAHGCTLQLLTRGNGIKSDVIRPGDRLRILTGRFSVVVDISDNELVVSLTDRFFKRYRVGTGKYERTPTGAFHITDRIEQPTWWRADGRAIPFGDKENVLGTHWLSLDIPRYGIHGTWEPDTVGKQESAGCIRLLNPDIEELYILLPVGTPVVIRE